MISRQLQNLMDTATTRWPDRPITTARAGQHVANNRVTLVDVESDSWKVAGITCSFRSNACQCRDHSIDPVGGKLRICEHLIAVMFVKRLAESQNVDDSRMRGNIPEVEDFLAECAGAERARLLVDIYYDRRTKGTKGDRYVLSGFHKIGQPERHLPYSDRVEFTRNDLVAALWNAGWRLEKKFQGQYMTWRLVVIPMTDRDRKLDPDLATAIGVLDVVSAHVIERNAQRAEMKRLFALETGERFASRLVGVGGEA